MINVGVIGLGNMGYGMAKNLLAGGFAVTAYDMNAEKLANFAALGGQAGTDAAAIGAASDIVFTMVVDAQQTRDVLLGSGKLLAAMKRGGIVVLTATIGSAVVREIAQAAEQYGVHIIDSPVSGGRIGAEAGTLTLMTSGNRHAYGMCFDALQAIAKDIHYVGAEVGQGQEMKACLQGLVGCIYGGIFEALALGVKAGLSAESIYAVIGTSVANTPIFQNTVPAIMARKFTGSGSTVYNTYKDLTITMALAQEHGVPMMTTGVATQFFQAANTRYPTNDNQCLIKLLEAVIGVEVKSANASIPS